MRHALLSIALLLAGSAAAQPANDPCANAAPIQCGQTANGTTAGATSDTAPLCGTSISAPGVWYVFAGNGQQVTMTTCPDNSYDTKLNVYTGSCGALTCVIGNDDIADGVYCSSVTFIAEAGTSYLILVQGYNNQTGPFQLSVTCLTCGAPQQPVVTPLADGALLSWVPANTGAAYTIEYGPAGFVQGNGLVANGTIGTDGPPAYLPGLTPGTDYEAYLREECTDGNSPWVGPLPFTTETVAPAANAICAQAQSIACGSDTEGDTQQGLFMPMPTCGSADVTTKGLWYSFTGTGEVATLSTCSGSGYDTKISVFTGGCAALACVAGNDDGAGCPGNTSRVVFPTAMGTEYLVLVHGYGNAQGLFSLSYTCAPACVAASNDQCGSASLVQVQPVGGCESSTGSTECAYAPAAPNPPCDPYGAVVDLWYAFDTGNAGAVTVTLTPESAPVVNMALYEQCGSPAYVECWTEVIGTIDLTDLAGNTTYLLRIWNGGGTEAGTFTLCVEGAFNVGIAEREAPRGIWPVPATEAVTVATVGDERVLRLFDLHGRCVAQQAVTGQRTSIDLRGLAPGAYAIAGPKGVLGRCVKE
jgi:hypothetical protein